MTASPLKKYVLPTALLCSSIFFSFTFPLAFLGSKPLQIHLEKEPIFVGRLKDIATPYLGLATVISLGAGVTSLALTGWRESNHQKHQIKQKLSNLEQELKVKEAQLDKLRFDETRLKAAGLDCFLEDGVKTAHRVAEVCVQQVPTSTSGATATSLIVIETQVPVVQFLAIPGQPLQFLPTLSSRTTVAKAVASWATAQLFLSFAQTKGRTNESAFRTSLNSSQVRDTTLTQLTQVLN